MHISLSLCVCVYVCTGRLCSLDWGMVIRVPQDLQLSLLEFIANLSAENYEEGMSVSVGLFCSLLGLLLWSSLRRECRQERAFRHKFGGNLFRVVFSK